MTSQAETLAHALVGRASVCYRDSLHSLGGANLVMAAAALTPRVRLATICNGVRESVTEAGVYHLRGVRQWIVAPEFPYTASRLWLFLVLSSPRAGTYPGYVRVMDDATDKAILFAHLVPHPHFEAGDSVLAA